MGDSSNSIPDWLRVLDLQEDDDDEFRKDDGGSDSLLNDGGVTSNINVLSSTMGPGLSPGHGCV